MQKAADLKIKQNFYLNLFLMGNLWRRATPEAEKTYFTPFVYTVYIC
jgi:hypothetical protein